MDNKQNPTSEDQPKKSDNLINDDIPAWLQGLEEPKIEDTSPISTQRGNSGWIKETESPDLPEKDEPMPEPDAAEERNPKTNPKEEETPDEPVPTVSNIINPSADALPDWLSDMTEVDPAAPTVQINEHQKTQPPQEAPAKESPPRPTREIIPDPAELPQPELPSKENLTSTQSNSNNDENSQEIPDFDFAQESEAFRELEMPEEARESEDELPPWLNQMILENERSPQSEKRDEAPATPDSHLSIEKTQPVQTDADEGKKERFTGEKTPEAPTQNAPSDRPQGPSLVIHRTEKNETDEIPSEQPAPQESKPASASHKEPERFTESAEEKEDRFQEMHWQTTDEENLPETLNLARELLEHGEMAQALDIFRGYVEQKEHLGVIQLWLSKAVQDPHRANTMEIWELLGDAALENGSSERAIYAYAKAIHLIL
jgi:hypothetical protein